MQIGDKMERLQKVIANSGYCSRRKAEEFIKQGKVKVNNKTIFEVGTMVNQNDMIEIDGNIIEKQSKEYILLYKPRGVVTTTSDDKHRKTVIDLIKSQNRLYPVGRLDYDTTGVLLITNDGVLANALMHPSSKIEKVYIAKIKGILMPKQIRALKNGVRIDNSLTGEAKVKVKKIDRVNNTSIVELIIHEGKNHQVKKMFEAVGTEVIKLKRERVAFLDLSGLKSGEYRKLTPKEVKILYSLINKKN